MKIVTFSKDAQRALGRLPLNVARLIRAKLDLYSKEPASLAAQIKTLKGYDDVKQLRVGDWRVLFSENGTVIASSGLLLVSRPTTRDRH